MKILLLFVCLLSFFSCSEKNNEKDNGKYADSIYHNGMILTMDDKNKEVESVAVKDGKIIYVGNFSDIDDLDIKGKDTKLIDLEGNTMLPGFVDPHSHVFVVGIQYMSANLYPPPDGNASSIADTINILKDYYETDPELYKESGYIVGSGYDDAQLKEKRHPNKFELDEAFPDKPVYLMHQSGHIGVANSKALELLNINSNTKNPQGGVIRRVAGTEEPNGILEEMSHFIALGTILNVKQEFSEEMLEKGIDTMISYGYTTAQEARAGEGQVDLIESFSKNKGLDIDIIIFPDVFMASNAVTKASKTYEEGKRYRVGGAKISLDGSPQGKTAWRDTPYVVPPQGQDSNYIGYPAVSREAAIEKIDLAFKNNWQVQAHANGEAAIELFIEAVEKAIEKYGTNDYRPVLIHGQFARKEHIKKMAELNIFPSLYPLHTYYWGDWHSEQTIGEPGVNNISPTGWALEEGMMFTTHHDAPIVPPNAMMTIWATVNRISRDGKDIGSKEQSPSVYDTLKAMTIWSAYQSFEEDSKGSIEIGKLADFVVLSENPLEVDKMDIDKIEVLETIKEDKSIYTKPADA